MIGIVESMQRLDLKAEREEAGGSVRGCYGNPDGR